MFLLHVLTKIPNKRNYTIQDYSNVKAGNRKVYIYEIKYTEDLLATGLTGSEYMYTSEKIAFYEDEEGNLKMSIGNYIYETPIQSIVENEYLKVDVISKKVGYDEESYEVKFTNRSEYTVVIADGKGNSEANLQLNNETRNRIENKSIVLAPGGTSRQIMSFQKFVDDGEISKGLIFGSIRVMENYSGTENIPEEIIQNEIDNALAKFSITVSIKEK